RVAIPLMWCPSMSFVQHHSRCECGRQERSASAEPHTRRPVETLVALDVLLRHVAVLAHGRRCELLATVAEDHGAVFTLVDIDQLPRRGACDARVLDEQERALVVDREIGRQLALLLPSEDLLEIVVGTKRSVSVVRTGCSPREACVVV